MPAWFFLMLILSAFGFELISLMNLSPGFAGYDYSFFIPRLFEGIYSFRAQGLLPPYYSSFLCGGFPLYGDPQSLFYSLPQFLSFAVNPWTAIEVSAVFFLISGGLGCYSLARKVFNLDSFPALASSILFAANGFYRSRMLIGHVTFQPFMLTPFLVFSLIYPSSGVVLPGISAALIASYFIQGGAHYVTVFSAIAVLLTLSLYFMVRTSGAGNRTVAMRIVLSATVTAGLCLSKLVAALSLMSHMRRRVNFDYVTEPISVLRLLYSQFVSPAAFPVVNWKPWEYDVSLGAAVWPLAALGVLMITSRILKTDGGPNKRNLLLWSSAFLLGVYFVFGMATGAPFWAPLIRTVPPFNQFRVNMRFSSSLILPLCLLAGVGFSVLKGKVFRLTALTLTIASCLFLAEVLRTSAANYMSFNLSEVGPFYKKMMSGADISAVEVDYKSSDDFASMVQRASNPLCYQTFYAKAPTGKLKPGLIKNVSDGNYNAINPSCYWFPAENNCRAGALVKEEERLNLELMLQGRNPNWKVSPFQHISNWTSFFCLLAVAAYLMVTVAITLVGDGAKVFTKRFHH